MHKRLFRGFTIVEVVVVIIMISIITAVTSIAYVQVQAGARNDERNAQMTLITNELERFYDQHGEYPPGCPDMNCSDIFLTANTASGLLTPNTTLATLTSILPGIKSGFGDPRSSNSNLPFKNRTAAEYKYYYFGGTVNYPGPTRSLSYAAHANFPCTIQSTLSTGQVGSYVIGYLEEKTNTWILKGGRNGIPMTVTAGTCVIVRG